MAIIRSSRVLYKWLLPVVFGAVKMEIVIFRLVAVVFFGIKCHVLYTFVMGHVGCCGGCVWVSKVAFLWVVCVCGLGIPVSGLGADCAITEVINYHAVASSWHFISTYYRRCMVKTTSNLLMLNIHKVRVFGNGVVSKIFGSKREETIVG